MIGPTVVTRMKQWSDLTRNRIDPSNWLFMKIAAMASQRQIPGVVYAAVLFRHDVFGVVK